MHSPLPVPPPQDLSEEEVARIVREHLETLFPKTCSKCGTVYETLRDYIDRTQPVGGAISYDAETGDWTPRASLGSFAFANCACGTTLSVATNWMPLDTRHQLLAWVRAEAERRGVDPQEIVVGIRQSIRRSVQAG